MGVKEEIAQYLIPNAFTIRFIESGDLLNFHHKWSTRLCYLAQEEIWHSCLEEAKQIRETHPMIGNNIFAPCKIRQIADKKPFCPEKNRFCGIKVWNLNLDEYNRII
jgi:thymidylate synthase ThyX